MASAGLDPRTAATSSERFEGQASDLLDAGQRRRIDRLLGDQEVDGLAWVCRAVTGPAPGSPRTYIDRISFSLGARCAPERFGDHAV